MTNPLTSLDELIWKQFEKVTQYAHKNYGWDKYDLAKATHLSSSIAMAGMCTYGSIYEAISHHYGASAFLGLFVVPIAHHHQSQCSFYEKLQEIELKTVKITNAAVKYPFYTSRSCLTLASLALTLLGVNHLIQASDSNHLLEGLMMALGGMGFGGSQSAHYFVTQISLPPSAKKPFWKTTYEMMRNKFKSKPQLEPAAEPTSEYTIIDEMIKPILQDHQ